MRAHNIAGYLALMNLIDRELGQALKTLKTRQDEICDPELYQERAAYAVSAERTAVDGFPRMELLSSARKTRSAPRNRRGGVRNSLPMNSESPTRA
jgi:hypothetical protein